MKIIRLEQGTPEWLVWRHGGIGGSDANIIMGVSPYKSREQLLCEKRDPAVRMSQAGNHAQRYGNKHEPVARRLYEHVVGEIMQPVCGQHDTISWMRVSLDGSNFEGDMILEVKCCNAKLHKVAMSGLVPSQYIPQVQHGLLVSGAKEAHYWSYHGQKGALVRVRPDPEYWEVLMREEALFWKEVTV